MSGKESWKSWAAILAVLIVTSLVAALWPFLSSQFGDEATRIEPEIEVVEVNLPTPVNGAETIMLNSYQAMGILTGVVVVVVVIAGIVLALANLFLSRQTAVVMESDTFKAQQAAFVKREKERLKQLRQERPGDPIPEHNMPRWSVISTSLIILLFVVFFGMIINGAFVPEGEYMIGDTLVNSTWPIVGGLVLITLIILIWRIRPQKLEAIADTDNGPVPWNFIWVLLLGLLVIGLGVGAMVYLNISL